MANSINPAARGNAPRLSAGECIVRPQDSLSSLAKEHGCTVDDFMKANPRIKHRDRIYDGDRLKIPACRTKVEAKEVKQDTVALPPDAFTTKPKDPCCIKPEEPKPASGLDAIRSGSLTLAKGARGDAVKELQGLLEQNGIKLKHGVDGHYGKEVQKAVKQFQKQNGLEPIGRVDQATLKKLDAGGAQKAKYPEYDKLFSDGVMRQTIGVGNDEQGYHKQEIKKLVDGLTKQGFHGVDVSTLSDADIKTQLGVDPKTVDRDSAYFVKHFQHDGKDVTALTRVITPATPNAKQKFADAMAHDEVVLYGGHGRYGSGPDFDDIKNPAGNYRIGDAYEAGHVTLGQNDLQKTRFDKGYQLMFFNGCNTKHYRDDLRTKALGKDTSNLDFIGTNTELYWDNTAQDLLSVTSGLTSGSSIDAIKEALNANQPAKVKAKVNDNAFFADGFGDNAVQAGGR